MIRHALAFSVLVIFGQSAAAQAAVGFAHGSEFQVTRLQGQVFVACPFTGPGAPTTANWGCAGEAFSPVAEDKLLAQADADHVRLTATHENGKIDEKTV